LRCVVTIFYKFTIINAEPPTARREFGDTVFTQYNSFEDEQ